MPDCVKDEKRPDSPFMMFCWLLINRAPWLFPKLLWNEAKRCPPIQTTQGAFITGQQFESTPKQESQAHLLAYSICAALDMHHTEIYVLNVVCHRCIKQNNIIYYIKLKHTT